MSARRRRMEPPADVDPLAESKQASCAKLSADLSTEVSGGKHEGCRKAPFITAGRCFGRLLRNQIAGTNLASFNYHEESRSAFA